MKTIVRLMLAAGLFGASGLFADEWAGWGVAELKKAQEASLEYFRGKVGATAYENVTGFSIEKSAQGNSARAKINYKDGADKKTASYFCHAHGEDAADIDCH